MLNYKNIIQRMKRAKDAGQRTTNGGQKAKEGILTSGAEVEKRGDSAT